MLVFPLSMAPRNSRLTKWAANRQFRAALAHQSCCLKRPVPHRRGPCVMVTSALASIPGHADCPKVVAGGVGKGKYQSQTVCLRQRSTNKADYLGFLAQNRSRKATSYLSREEPAEAPPTPGTVRTAGGEGHLTCCDTGGRMVHPRGLAVPLARCRALGRKGLPRLPAVLRALSAHDGRLAARSTELGG